MPVYRDTDQLYRLFKDFTERLNRDQSLTQRLARLKLVLGFHLSDLKTDLVFDWRQLPLRGQLGRSDLPMTLEIWTSTERLHEFWGGQVSLAQLTTTERSHGALHRVDEIDNLLPRVHVLYRESLQQLGFPEPWATPAAPTPRSRWRDRVASVVSGIANLASRPPRLALPGPSALKELPAPTPSSGPSDIVSPPPAPVTPTVQESPVIENFSHLNDWLIPIVEGDAPPRRFERLDQALPTEETPLRLEMLRRMTLIRAVETRLGEELKAGHLPLRDLPLTTGQEGVAVGACFALRPGDQMVTTHRGLGHFIARGSEPSGLVAELYGRGSGVCGGKGGPFNLADKRVGALATGIIGASTVLATGWALAAQLESSDQVTLCFLGDGASNQGMFHEALNLAASRNLPIVFVLINDGTDEGTRSDGSNRVTNLAQRAAAYGMGHSTVDGNDAWIVYRSVRAAVRLARSGDGPTLVEARILRLQGLPEDSRDKADPVLKLYQQLVDSKAISPADAREMAASAQVQADRAIERAQSAPSPTPDNLTTYVYSPEPAVLYQPHPIGSTSRTITYAQAVNEALSAALKTDPLTYLIGPALASGGPFKTVDRLLAEFGDKRVIDAPISPNVIVGSAVTAAAAGRRPIVDLAFADFLALAADPILNHAAKLRYTTGGQYRVPLVIRIASGPAQGWGPQHSQSLEAWLAGVPGLLVAVPSTPYDAKGLLTTAIRSNNPVLFFEPKALYGLTGPAPEENFLVPFGVADIKRAGTDCTIVAIGAAVHEALAAADSLAEANISVEVIDPRTLSPFDWATVLGSAARTGRLVIVEEAPLTLGWGAEVAARAARHLFGRLRAPIERVTASSTPVPYSPALARTALAGVDQIVDTVKRLVG